MEQREFEKRVTDFVGNLNGAWGKSICGMIRPALLSCSAAEMSLEMAFSIQSWELNPGGVVHGGVMATLLDTALGTLTATVSGCMNPTISLNVNYLRPAPGDGTIVVRAQVTMLGRSIIYTSARAWDSREPDKLVATAEGTYKNHRS